MVERSEGADAPKEHWSYDELEAMPLEEQLAALKVMGRRQQEEYDREYGPVDQAVIGVRKGELQTITRLISTPESRAAARAREEGGDEQPAE